jgi:riboflavin synthase
VFTGLIQELGTLIRADSAPEGRRLRIRAPGTASSLRSGDSVAVNGVCQTVTGPVASGVFETTAVPETLRRTTLGALHAGARVQLELPLRPGDRLGGHWVNGHVDAVASILEIRPGGRDAAFRMALPSAIAPYVVEKGSIAVDGVSLTVGEVDARSFRVYIIPETLERTLFGAYRVGDRVNLEADLLAKYVERILRVRGTGQAADLSRPVGGAIDGEASAGGSTPASLDIQQVLERWMRERS